ncbi:MAG TPA: hypothetical protein VMJ90_08690 [Anaerolineales bacterium]|nr:hypothetical protein [Anaerolineales bacterium]
MKNKLPILLALLALVASSLACALGGDPTLSNTRTALDEDGINTTSSFGAFDTVYVVNDLANGVSGNVVSSDWYAESVEGVDPNFLIDTVEYTVVDETYNGIIFFYFEPPDGGWPLGTYRVEVSFNGVPSATVRFTVQ